MRFRSLFLISPALWLSPFLVLLAIMHPLVVAKTPDPYPLFLTVKGSLSVLLLAPVCAACAAWEGGRLRRAGWTNMPIVRSSPAIALSATLPTILVGWLAVSAAIASKFVSQGVEAGPDLRVIAVAFATIVGHALLGFALGQFLAPVVAVPSILILDYAWMGLPGALEPLWLRHLTGGFLGCCSVAHDLAPEAIAGALIGASGLVMGSLLLVRHPITPQRLILALGTVALGFSGGATSIAHLGPTPQIPRNTALLVCSSSPLRVCVWPEHSHRLAEVTSIAEQTAIAWQRFKLNVPETFTEQSGPTVQPALRFLITQDATPTRIRFSLVQGLLYAWVPSYPECGVQGYPGGRAEQYIYGWLADVAGIPQEEIGWVVGTEVLETVQRVRTYPAELQQDWLDRNLAAMRACGIEPQLEPAL